MAMSTTRKRGACFIFEKPLVSRLPFEVEVEDSLAKKRAKRARIAATTITETITTRPPSPPAHEDLDDKTSENVETQPWWTRETLQERHRREEADSCSSSSAIAAVDVDVDRGCWLGDSWSAREGRRDTGGRTRPFLEKGGPECLDKGAVPTVARGGVGKL